jgi:hypothetical protein
MKKNWYEILYFPTVLILCLIFKISADIGKEKEYKKGYLDGQNDIFNVVRNNTTQKSAEILMKKRDSLGIDDGTIIKIIK